MFADYILPGILIGIGAALSPGPILILVLSESIRGGLRSGFKVAIAPSILDVLFVAPAIVFAESISTFRPVVGVLSLCGAVFLLFLAYRNATASKVDLPARTPFDGSLAKAIVADALNPHLYLFWFSVAVPIFAKGNLTGSILFAFALSFAAFVGHFGLALLVCAARVRLLDYLQWILRLLSIPLLIMALVFAWEGMGLL